MTNFSKFLVISFFIVLFMVTYLASILGWGVTNIQDHRTMKAIEKECPNFYTNREGDCLQRSFRSLYFQKSYDAGGSGSAGK